MSPAGVLILIRHGQSTLNAGARFTGQLDPDLTHVGVQQAHRAAQLIEQGRLIPGAVLTSPMRRARRTAEVIAADLGLPEALVRGSWRLVERDYGSLTGMSKRRARQILGAERYVDLRRTLYGRPAPAGDDQLVEADCYVDPTGALPRPGSGEALSDVIDRVAPCWDEIQSLLLTEIVLVIAHGNSLRALCALIDGLSEDEVANLNLPAGQPLVYMIDPAGGATPRGGAFLDPRTAHVAAAKLAREGGT